MYKDAFDLRENSSDRNRCALCKGLWGLGLRYSKRFIQWSASLLKTLPPHKPETCVQLLTCTMCGPRAVPVAMLLRHMHVCIHCFLVLTHGSPTTHLCKYGTGTSLCLWFLSCRCWLFYCLVLVPIRFWILIPVCFLWALVPPPTLHCQKHSLVHMYMSKITFLIHRINMLSAHLQLFRESFA